MILFNFILSLCFLGTENNLEPGIYESDNNLFIELRLSENLDSVTFYFPGASEKSYGLQWSTIEISPNFRHGVIEVEGNQIHFKEMDSDMLPSTRPKLSPMKFENNIIYLNCENISKYLFGRSDFSNCTTEFIEFKKK